MRTALALIGGIGLLLAGAAAAHAQFPEGRINAAAYGPLPPGSVVFVVPRDDSEDNLVLKDLFQRALESRGYQVAPDAPFIMNFWTSGSYDLVQTPGRYDFRPGLLKFGAKGGNSGRTVVDGQIKLFSSEGGGLFQNPAKRPRQGALGAARYRLDASVSDRQSGRRVWQGQAYIDVSTGDPLSVNEAMVPLLVQNVGETARRQTFILE